ncbi:hypothetical protein BDP27DRAFT_1375445 [Rhodocollybia butyracea]|uniref:Uncharacterized protein n=1 Tax=Rhodocollybia butyracea TaxID=206335 RepID=A0A9P5TVJ4_9AGAR|nr:hypothetical protein BDP27DRAFT_1375445 [Rhodocollybia butyracea]
MTKPTPHRETTFPMDTTGGDIDDAGSSSAEVSDSDSSAGGQADLTECDGHFPEGHDVWESRGLAGWWEEPDLPVVSEQARITLLRELRADWFNLPVLPWHKNDSPDLRYDHLQSEDWAHLQLFLCSEAAREANAGVPTLHWAQLFARIDEAKRVRAKFRHRARRHDLRTHALRDQIKALQCQLEEAERNRQHELAKSNRARDVSQSLNKLVFIYRTRAVTESFQ